MTLGNYILIVNTTAANAISVDRRYFKDVAEQRFSRVLLRMAVLESMVGKIINQNFS